MLKIDRRKFLAVATALIPSFLLSKAHATGSFAMAKNTSHNPGMFLAKSASIKVGQSRAYAGKDMSGRTIEVIISREKSGLVALDGTCTHKGCLVSLEKRQLVCPCHGSIFQASDGAVVMGPNGAPKNSISPLHRFKVVEESGNIFLQ